MRIAIQYIIKEAHNHDLSTAGVRPRAEIDDKEHHSTDENEIGRQCKDFVFAVLLSNIWRLVDCLLKARIEAEKLETSISYWTDYVTYEGSERELRFPLAFCISYQQGNRGKHGPHVRAYTVCDRPDRTPKEVKALYQKRSAIETAFRTMNLAEALEGALAHDGPAMVEVIIEQVNPDSGAVITGEWDLADLKK